MNSLDLLEKAYEHFINAKKFEISDEPLKQYSNLSAAHTLYMVYLQHEDMESTNWGIIAMRSRSILDLERIMELIS